MLTKLRMVWIFPTLRVCDTTTDFTGFALNMGIADTSFEIAVGGAD